MIRKFLYDKKLRVKLCISMLGLALILSCQSAAEREKQLFSKDLQANVDLQKINADLNVLRRITPENFEILRNLRTKYPTSTEIAQSFKSALAVREDWEELAALLNEVSAAVRTREDSILLAKVFIKLGRFADSSSILQSIGAASPNDVELRSLSAIAHFNGDNLDEAAADLDAIWSAVVGQKRVDDMNLRALIYFRKKDYSKAIEILNMSINSIAVNPLATNTMGRVYAAMGDAEKAEYYRKETVTVMKQVTAGETQKRMFVSLSRELETAWNAQQYETVISVAKEMLPISEEKNKTALLKYIELAESEINKQNPK